MIHEGLEEPLIQDSQRVLSRFAIAGTEDSIRAVDTQGPVPDVEAGPQLSAVPANLGHLASTGAAVEDLVLSGSML